jgi:hypothetical protein
MKITTRWANDSKTIICSVIEEGWTWEDFIDNANHIGTLLDQVDHPANIVIYMQSKRPPKDLLGHFPTASQAPFFTHPNAGLLIVVGTEGITRAMANILMKTYRQGHRVRLVETIEEAFAITVEA